MLFPDLLSSLSGFGCVVWSYETSLDDKQGVFAVDGPYSAELKMLDAVPWRIVNVLLSSCDWEKLTLSNPFGLRKSARKVCEVYFKCAEIAWFGTPL